MENKQKESKKKRYVSYSQYVMWAECPRKYQWLKLQKKYIDTSIHLVFGSAMHEVIQHYLKTMYDITVKKADAINLGAMLKLQMKEHFLREDKRLLEHTKDEELPLRARDFIKKEEMVEFASDGLEIIQFFKKKRANYFTKRNWELKGIEIKLEEQLYPGIFFVGYIDLVVRNKKTGFTEIYDLKTSKGPWKKKWINDKKLDQLRIYKYHYHKKFLQPFKNMEATFLVMKRKIWEGADFPIPRFQRFRFAQAERTCKKAVDRFDEFVTTVFDTDTGDIKEDYEFPPTPSKNACKFCPFNGVTCDVGVS